MIALLVSVYLSTAFAAPPESLPIQGFLSDDAGVPLDGPYDVRFRLYTTSTTTAAEVDITTTIDADNGSFAAYVDVPHALYGAEDNLYLGVAIEGGAELAPRFQIATAPFAGRAVFADECSTLDGFLATDFRLTADTVDWTDLDNVPANLLDGDADTTYTAGTGVTLTGTTFAANQSTIEGWATGVSFDTAAEVTAALGATFIANQTCTSGFVLAANGSGGWTCTDPAAPLVSIGSRLTTAESSISTLQSSVATLQSNVTASGDLSGSYPGPTVTRVQGNAVAATTPAAGQLLKWNGASSRWEPTSNLSVNAVTPAWGSTRGGNSVVLSGSNFTAGSTITVGGSPATVTNVNATQLTFTAPLSTTSGAVNIVLTGGDGQRLTFGGYTYAGAGDTAGTAATTCDTLLTSGAASANGSYFINPTGTGAFRAYCDLTTFPDEGWTVIAYAPTRAIALTQVMGTTSGTVGDLAGGWNQMPTFQGLTTPWFARFRGYYRYLEDQPSIPQTGERFAPYVDYTSKVGLKAMNQLVSTGFTTNWLVTTSEGHTCTTYYSLFASQMWDTLAGNGTGGVGGHQYCGYYVPGNPAEGWCSQAYPVNQCNRAGYGRMTSAWYMVR